MTRCEICGRHIRTGRKYCYEHRHSTNPLGRPPENIRRKDLTKESIMILLVGITIFFFSFGALYIPSGWKWKLIEVFWLIFGVFIIGLGLKMTMKIEKVLLREKIRAQEQRKKWTDEIKGDIRNSSEGKRKIKKIDLIIIIILIILVLFVFIFIR